MGMRTFGMRTLLGSPDLVRMSWSGSGQRLDRDVAELDRVVVAGEAEEARGAVLAGVGLVGHERR